MAASPWTTAATSPWPTACPTAPTSIPHPLRGRLTTDALARWGRAKRCCRMQWIADLLGLWRWGDYSSLTMDIIGAAPSGTRTSIYRRLTLPRADPHRFVRIPRRLLHPHRRRSGRFEAGRKGRRSTSSGRRSPRSTTWALTCTAPTRPTAVRQAKRGAHPQPGAGSPMGAVYVWLDDNVQLGQTTTTSWRTWTSMATPRCMARCKVKVAPTPGSKP